MRKTMIAALAGAAGFAAAIALGPVTESVASSGTYRQLNLFGDVFERVRAEYVRDVDDAKMVEAAIDGMLTSLDPHSGYMNAKDFGDMQVQTRGEFAGVGIEVTQEDGVVKVVTPIDDTPAAKAGIAAGDSIVAINGETTQGLTLNQAVENMRGPAGSAVTLSILKKDEKKPVEITLTRAMVKIQSVRWKREGDVGYIRITQFNEQTEANVEKAVRALAAEIGPNLRGYVLDMRNNPGGLLDQAIEVSDDFLEGGEIVSTKGRRANDRQVYFARSGDLADGKPIVVLINQGSASAAEIVAGALQDHERAKIFGAKSFGKGSVQTIIPLSGGADGALRLTTAKYYTPAGRSIQALGIEPDVRVMMTNDPAELEAAKELRSEATLPGHLDAEAEAAATDPGTPIVTPPADWKESEDFQLHYALQYLRGQTVAGATTRAAQ